MLSKLKILKKKIDDNIEKLEKICPYSQNVSDAISILIQRDASDMMVKIWMQGVLELAKDVEIALEIMSKKEKLAILKKNKLINSAKTYNYLNQKERLKKLQTLIVLNLGELINKYPHTPLIYEAMDQLINMDATDDFILPWLNSIDDFVALLDTKSSL